MARKSPVAEGRRMLLWLGALTIFLILLLSGSVVWGGGTWVPKLALDLEGGTQMILAPRVEGENKSITEEQLNQAVEIIRQRVDGSGVAEAQVSTQSGANVVVAMPGTPTAEQRRLIQASADMAFRPVIGVAQGEPTAADKMPPDDKLPKPTGEPKDSSDQNWVTPELYKRFLTHDCSKGQDQKSDPKKPAISCSENGSLKYLLGPVEVKGQEITDANFGLKQGAQGATTNQWSVNLTFNAEGAEKFKTITTRLNGFFSTNPNDPKAQFAIVLDGKVLSAPRSEAVITDGRSQISGSFTEASAKALAEQLKYGALPISFEIQSDQQISATLGAQQLEMGLVAGIIGLLLVVIYSLCQYRMLGLVTVTSLLVAGVLTYLAIGLLGWSQNYRLSLAGVAGLIVAIGQTADSFIVYFERIRDELREGRSLVTAVEEGWKRAKRTVLASKAVNLLAAIVLYFVAVGNVRGFAFTLGLTAVADLLVVFLFTHPTMQLLARWKFFAHGHRFSGLSPERLGAVPFYRGAGRLRDAPRDVPRRNKAARGEANRRQSIAERRAAELERERTTSKDRDHLKGTEVSGPQQQAQGETATTEHPTSDVSTKDDK